MIEGMDRRSCTSRKPTWFEMFAPSCNASKPEPKSSSNGMHNRWPYCAPPSRHGAKSPSASRCWRTTLRPLSIPTSPRILRRQSRRIGSRWSPLLGISPRLVRGCCCWAARKESETITAAIALETGDDDLAVSAVTLLELAHGVIRADNAERREKRQHFLDELISVLPVHPVTAAVALRAGQIDGQTQVKGIRIRFPISRSG